MTDRRRSNSVVRNPWLLPLVAVRLAGTALNKGQDLARSTRKGMTKRMSRARRRKTNERAIAHDVAVRDPKPEISQHNQTESYLLKLPFELRQQIYDLYFERGSFIMTELDTDGYKLHAVTSTLLPGRLGSIRVPYHDSRRQLLQLPLTCRHVYGETIEYVYRRNVFRFIGHDLALQLPRLSVFPRKHLESLRSVDLVFAVDRLIKDFKFGNASPNLLQNRGVEFATFDAMKSTKLWREWTAFWECLASLPGLERLHVEFIGLARLAHWTHIKERMYEWLLEPLLQFERRGQLSVFVVQWPRGWKPREEWTSSTCMPFEMEWT